ncbi:M3 family oligoendopeptidase, partial [bacterium]|nr:M3 family oligoendopeptidase [bacterium]
MTQDNVPSWNLSDLYSDPDDERIGADMQKAEDLAIAFKDKYKERIKADDLEAERLCQAMADYQAILELLYKADSFADLLFAADTSKPENGALLQKVSERVSQISTNFIFFDLELGQISDSKWEELRTDPRLGEYLHAIEQERLRHKYALSEAEETVLEETANCRGRAFARLFTETVSRLKFPVTVDGELKELNQSELSALFYSPDRELRRQAAQVQSQVLQDSIHPLHFAYSTIILEKLTLDRLRGFSYPEEARHISNELPAAAIDTMIDTVVKNYPSVAQFYRLKKQLLGVDELFHYDRYAPLPQKSQAKVSFEQAKQTVLEAFGEFSPLFREKAEQFFAKGWIDAAMRPGKRGGAFCAGITPSIHPYVLMNFTATARDVETLAHELGHGIHDLLASKQNLLNYHPVLPLAETASTCCDLLVFNKLLKELPDTGSKLALVAEHLESVFATVFRQTAMYRFEQRVFRQRSEQGELTHEQMSDIWQECLQEMFGDSVTMGEDHRITWSYIPHFIHTPFYVYAYSFGELL